MTEGQDRPRRRDELTLRLGAKEFSEHGDNALCREQVPDRIVPEQVHAERLDAVATEPAGYRESMTALRVALGRIAEPVLAASGR